MRQRIPYGTLLTADAISTAGNVLTRIALPWFVLETTGSATQTAITVAAGTAPIVITGFLGGALVDRVGYRRMSVVSDLASALSVASIPLLHGTIGLEFWQLVLLVVLGALLDSPGQTARQALYPEAAQASGIMLERSNTLVQIVRRISLLIGPPVGGILIVAVGASTLLWLDAVSFVISAAAVLFLIPARFEAHKPRDEASRYTTQVAEGWRFLRRDNVLVGAGFLVASGNLIAEPVYLVVFPLLANFIYDSPVALGFMYAALAAGSLFGNAYYLVLAPRLPRRQMLLFGFSVRAATFCLLPFEPPLWLLSASVFLNAATLEPANTIGMTLFQERTPPGMRGRVFGILWAIGTAFLTAGILAYGVVAGALGLDTLLVIVAALNLTVPVVILLASGFRDIERPAAEPSPIASPKSPELV